MTKSEADEFELSVIQWVTNERVKYGLTMEKLGSLAFPDNENPMVKVRNLQHQGRRMRLTDFCSFCQALEQHPAGVLFFLWETWKMKKDKPDK